MHFAHTEHKEQILCTATQKKTAISEIDKNLKHKLIKNTSKGHT